MILERVTIMSKTKQESGGARLLKAGKKPILLGPTVEQKMTLDAAAAKEGRPTSQFVLFHALQAAGKILRKSAG